MNSFEVIGGKKLKGEIVPQGAKNEALQIISAVLLTAQKVTITNIATKKTVTYQIVGEKEADLKAGKISAGSPIGKGLMGKTRGEVAEVQAPTGVIKFKIEDITI